MRYLLDATVLIDHGRGHPGAVAVVRSLFEEPSDLLTCDAVVAEALSGGSEEERLVIASLVSALEYVSTHPDAAHWAAESRRMRGTSSPRTLGDALIAGVAWFTGATVVTRNAPDFERQGVPVLAY